MNPTTPDTRTAGQIALTPEALFELLKEHDILRENSHKNFNVYPRAFRDKFAAVIASLPRAGVRLTARDVFYNDNLNTPPDYWETLGAAAKQSWQKKADRLNACLLQFTPPTQSPATAAAEAIIAMPGAFFDSSVHRRTRNEIAAIIQSAYSSTEQELREAKQLLQNAADDVNGEWCGISKLKAEFRAFLSKHSNLPRE